MIKFIKHRRELCISKVLCKNYIVIKVKEYLNNRLNI